MYIHLYNTFHMIYEQILTTVTGFLHLSNYVDICLSNYVGI